MYDPNKNAQIFFEPRSKLDDEIDKLKTQRVALAGACAVLGALLIVTLADKIF